MNSASPFDAKERIRDAVDIVDLVGSYLPLRRQGRNYVAQCPWHDDRRPSLQVNPERQSWKCWVCDIGGDIFSFVMKIESVDFREALELLADRAGIELTPQRPARSADGPRHTPASPSQSSSPGNRRADGPRDIDKRTLFRAMAWTAQQFTDALMQAPQSEIVRQYLVDRRISDDSVSQWQIGFAPNERNWLVRRVREVGATADVLVACGVLGQRDNDGSYYDFFSGRLMFPIRDQQGRVVGFGGRVVPGIEPPIPAKYINSRDTLLFAKHRLLYGLDVAKETSRRSRRLLVTEGYTDCIACHEHGFSDTVAVLGTALGSDHVRLLKRHADRIVLVLDGDEAGRNRAAEVLELFVAEQADLRILTLPEGLDPADCLERLGRERFGAMVDNEARDALEHAIDFALAGIDVDRDVHAAGEALDRLLAVLAKTPRAAAGPAATRFELIMQRLARVFRIGEEKLRSQVATLRRGTRQRPTVRFDAAADDIDDDRRTSWEEEKKLIDHSQRWLLEALIQHADYVPLVAERIEPEYFASSWCRSVFEHIVRIGHEDRPETDRPETDQAEDDETPSGGFVGVEVGLSGRSLFDRLMLTVDDPNIKGFIVELAEQGDEKPIDDPEAYVLQLAAGLRQSYERQHRRAPAEPTDYRELSSDPEIARAALIVRQEQERFRRGSTDPTEG